MLPCRGLALGVALLAASAATFASGFKVNEQGAKAGGMGDAFAGQADDPTTISMNLAGIGQLPGTRTAVTAALLYVPGREFSSDIDLVLADQHADNQLFLLPSLFLTSDLGTCDWHVGIGVYSMYGLTQDWNENGSTPAPPLVPGGFARNVDRADLDTVFVNPVASYDLLDHHVTLAAGFVYGYADFQVDSTPVIAVLGQDLAELEQEAAGSGYSFNLGVHARLYEDRLRIGAYYRHEMSLDLNGEFEADALSPVLFTEPSFETDLEAEFDLPGAAGVGVAVDVSSRLTVEADFEWNFWGAFDRVDVDLEEPLVSPVVGPVVTSADLTRAPRWDDSWAVRVGAQVKMTHHLRGRAGYFHDQTPVPESTLEPSVPDGDRNGFTLGLGYERSGLTVDVAYMLVLIDDMSVQNDATAPQNPRQDGTYRSDPVHAFMVTVGLRF